MRISGGGCEGGGEDGGGGGGSKTSSTSGVDVSFVPEVQFVATGYLVGGEFREISQNNTPTNRVFRFSGKQFCISDIDATDPP